MDWTHKEVVITDIRKVPKLYIISINDKKISSPLFVSEKIFDERLKLYFLKDAAFVSREEIKSVQWNMYITKDHYIKINDDGVKEFPMDENKFYVSYLDIAGPLSSFQMCSKPQQERNK